MESANETTGCYSWTVVLAAFIVYFLIDGLFFTFGILLVELIEEFEEPIASTAALSGIFLGFDAIASPFSGSLSDAFGRRPVTLVGAAVLSCGLFISTFAPSIAWLYLTYGVLGGTGYGLMCTPPFAAVMEHFTERKGLAAGIAMCGSGVGIFTMSLLTSYLLDAFGLRGTFLVLSGIMLNGVPCGLIFRKPLQIANFKEVGHKIATSNDMAALSLKQKLKHIFVDILEKDNASIFRDFQCLCFLLSTVFYGMAFFVPFSFLPEQAVEMGVEKDKAAWLTSAMGTSNTFGRLWFGWLANRCSTNLPFLLKCILLLTAVSLPVSLLLTSFETKMVFACCFGFLYGGYIVTVPLALAEMVSVENVGKTTGLFISMLAGSNIVGAPIVGWTIDVTGEFKVCYFLAGSESLVAFLILMLPQLRNVCRTKDTLYQTTHL